MTSRRADCVPALVLAIALTASGSCALADPTASAGFAAPDKKASVEKSKSASTSELDTMLTGSSADQKAPNKTLPYPSAQTPMISGASPYLMGTAQMDLESVSEPHSKTLQGGVSEEGTTPGTNGKVMLPEMDCVGFAGQTAIDGSATLKGMATNGKPGYHTDGNSWMISGDYPVICSVFAGDSCEQQGMAPGDIILELNGASCYKLSGESILSLFRAWDANMRNHYTLKRGNQIFRVVTQITWHPFGSGSYEESLWKATWSKFKY